MLRSNVYFVDMPEDDFEIMLGKVRTTPAALLVICFLFVCECVFVFFLTLLLIQQFSTGYDVKFRAR